MLIANAEIWQGPTTDIRISDGRIAGMGRLQPATGERVIDAAGGALLPGLHDHHIHLAATAAARESVACGPPEVTDADALADALARKGDGWLRGIGYHESVAGMLSRAQLDEWVPHRPVRIQHRSGRMWFLNSRAIEALLALATPPAGLERADGVWTGRLFDEDAWLRATLAGSPPDLAQLGRDFGAFGVAGVTDMSPSNAVAEVRWLAGERARGFGPEIVVAGTPELAGASFPTGMALGPVKIHLHEHAMPDLDATIALAVAAHQQGRAIAIHCTTELELVFALALLRAAGAVAGDRIEHAGIAPDALVEQIAETGLQVVSQPGFIAERGDQYRDAVDRADWPHLYRLRAFLNAGVTLAAGSDAPSGGIDPWAAMRAACSRRTRGGFTLGADEALSPEQALALFLADPLDLTRQRRIAVGEPASLCLLDRPWRVARGTLASDMVRATMAGGTLIHDAVDQPPFQRLVHGDTAT